MKKNKKKLKKRPLTLIELLAIIVIVWILLIIIIPTIKTLSERNNYKISEDELKEIGRDYGYQLDCYSKENNVWKINKICSAYKNTGTDDWIHFNVTVFNNNDDLDYYKDNNKNPLTKEVREGDITILITKSGGILEKKFYLDKKTISLSTSTDVPDNEDEMDKIIQDIIKSAKAK